MKIFNTIAALEAASLKAGQLVRVKGVGLFSVESSGAGYTLANGNKAVIEDANIPDPSDVTSGTQPTAATMSYVPAGTGAVTTDVQSKLRETVSVEDFGAVGDGVTDDYEAILAAIATGKDVEAKGVYGVGILSGRPTTTYFSLASGQTFRGGTFVALPNATSIVWGFFSAIGVDGAIFDDIEVIGLGNAGSFGSVLDAFGIIQSSNCILRNCRTDLTKRHGLFMMESNDNHIYNFNAKRCNRQNLGVGVQLQGSGFNYFNGVEIKDVGSNGVDYNKSAVGSQDATRYGVTNVGANSTYNTMLGLQVRGCGINNINVTGGDPLTNAIADDDYYGINIIQGSDFNIFHVVLIENVGKDLALAGTDTYVSALRIFEASANQITVDKIENVYNGTGDIIKIDTDCDGNIITIRKTKTYGNVFQASSDMVSRNKLVIGDLPRAGSLYGTSFKYLANTATTHADGILDGWSNNFGTTLGVSNGELTITGTGGSGKYIKQTDVFSSDFAVFSFEYKTSGAPVNGAFVGIQDAPFDVVQLPESAVWVQTFVLLARSTDGATDIAFWADTGDNTGRVLSLRNMTLSSPDGTLFNVDRIPQLRAAPITGTYNVGDYIQNITPTVGQPKGWYCTVAGSPATWVADANL